MKRLLFWAVVALAALFIWTGRPGVLVASAAEPAVCDPNPKPANFNFTLKDMNGKPVKLASFKGRVVVLDFWATWCGPCKLEIPGFVKLETKYHDKGLSVIGVSIDDKAPLLPPFARQFKMNYPVLVGLGEQSFQDAYGPLWAVPTTFVIGRDGTICKKHEGISSLSEFEKEIKALL